MKEGGGGGRKKNKETEFEITCCGILCAASVEFQTQMSVNSVRH